MVGYTTLYRPVKVEMADRVNEQVIDAVKMEPAATMLDEVTVTATKIKMVMHGDTLVYNASAFKLSQGSMLDALIRQLPGATLQDGLIKVNGRTVSSLLIDGRDFFKGCLLYTSLRFGNERVSFPFFILQCLKEHFN